MSRRDLLIVAGEASGDLHGARMLHELRLLVPDLRTFGLGTDELAGAGQRQVADVREISVVGIAEAAGVLVRAKEILDRVVAECERTRPAAAVLIDFPEFNLRLARRLKWLGIPVIYYISPQIWAWRRGRVRAISEVVDRMLVLFEFEVGFYRRFGVPVTWVGHPLVDEVPVLPVAWDQEPKHQPLGRLRLALLPGSRRSEVAALLPRMVEAVAHLKKHVPVSARLIRARTVDGGFLRELLGDSGIEIVDGNRFDAIADSHLAFCASGTATLEVGLLGTPLAVLYRLNSWSHFLARMLVRLPHFSLVNLVLGRAAVPELLQHDTEPERIAEIAWSLVSSGDRLRKMRRSLADLRPALGAHGASARAARAIAPYLGAELAA
ncbi:MAG: lipid-A-disaccharide synthase [Thermoanaerobaculia bacterium]